MAGTRRIVISAVVLAVASVVVIMMLASRSTSSAISGMSGMDHGTGEATASSSAHEGSGDMPGMDMSGADHGTGEATASPPTPTMAPDMPGMDMSGTDHGTGEATTSPPPASSGDMPGMDMSGTDSGHSSMAAESAASRPLAPVLGTFGGGTSAVLLAAGFLRRKDRIANQAKQAARAARRSAT